jgi:hypothetical protein
MTARPRLSMAKRITKDLALMTCLTAMTGMVGLTGCILDRHTQATEQPTDDNPPTKQGYNQPTDQAIEDSRTAERVREALAAGANYKYDGVKVMAKSGVVQLSGFVNTLAQSKSAAEIVAKVPGVKQVEINLSIKY